MRRSRGATERAASAGLIKIFSPRRYGRGREEDTDGPDRVAPIFVYHFQANPARTHRRRSACNLYTACTASLVGAIIKSYIWVADRCWRERG